MRGCQRKVLRKRRQLFLRSLVPSDPHHFFCIFASNKQFIEVRIQIRAGSMRASNSKQVSRHMNKIKYINIWNRNPVFGWGMSTPPQALVFLGVREPPSARSAFTPASEPAKSLPPIVFGSATGCLTLNLLSLFSHRRTMGQAQYNSAGVRSYVPGSFFASSTHFPQRSSSILTFSLFSLQLTVAQGQQQALHVAGAEPELFSQDGFADVFFAAKMGNLDVLKFFIEGAKVSPNIKDAKGHTPLYFAAHANKPEVVQYLLSHGVDLDLASPEGRDTWTVSKNVEIRNMLLSCCRCSDHELYLQLAGVKPAPVAVATAPQRFAAPPQPQAQQRQVLQSRVVVPIAHQLPLAGPQPQMSAPFAMQPLNVSPIQAQPLSAAALAQAPMYTQVPPPG